MTLTNLLVERPLFELAAKPLNSRAERQPVVAQLFVVAAERMNVNAFKRILQNGIDDEL